MDKSEAMRHGACLPDSWWEFAIEHAVYCYNRTPIKCLKWCTPFEVIHRQKPDISKLRVFGCGAYVYLPPSVRKNKLSPKSELMVHIGIVDGIKGYRFMRPNGSIFTAPSALFDEEMYPRCKTQTRRPTTRLNEPVDEQPSQATEDAPHAPPPPDENPWDMIPVPGPPTYVPRPPPCPSPAQPPAPCYACFWYVSDCLLLRCGFTIRIGIDWIAGYHSGTPVLYCSVAFITSDGGLSMDWTELCAKLLARLFVCTILLVFGGTSRTTPSARIVCI